MAKRKQRPPKRRAGRSVYQQGIDQADEVLAENGIEITQDNWQEIALDYYPSSAAERQALAHYIAEHHDRLDGVTWTREILRLDIFLQVEEHDLIIDHYKRTLSQYPHCPPVELWVAHEYCHSVADLWQARRMYLALCETMPDYPQVPYQLGFIHFLLGDFAGALAWYDRAAALWTEEFPGLAVELFYNRGTLRYQIEKDNPDLAHDFEIVLQYEPNHSQAKRMLQALKGKRWWKPW